MTARVEFWDSAGGSDVGLVRQLNEDSFLNRPDSGVWAVADGMGGHAHGDIASQTVCAALAALVLADTNLPAAVDLIDECLIGVNRQLLDMAQSEDAGTVIGCTVVAMVIGAGYGVCLWAGDSRLYRLREGVLALLSVDHSLAEESPDESYTASSGYQNVITRAVGANEELFLDVEAFALQPGDRYLLCSDGLNKELTDPQIEKLMRSGSAQESTTSLIEQALKAGGSDNVTAVVADYRLQEK